MSYRRRGEGAGYGGRVADKLVEHFGVGQCFRDVDDIESGVDFVKTIQEAVGTCEVLVAIIGPDWTTQTDARGTRRLDDPKDFVRLEVAAALQRDIRVIPVLVGGADIPSEHELPDVLSALSRRQVHELTDTRWEYDITKLVTSIESIGIRPLSRSKGAGLSAATWKTAAGLAAIGGAGLAVASLALYSGASILSRSSVSGPESKPVRAQVAHLDETARSSQDAAQQMQRALEHERKERQEAERIADLERTKRREREDDLDRTRKDSAAKRVEPEARRAQPVSQTVQYDTFSGTQGRVRVTWQHEGVVYTAVVVTNGTTGSALVNYVDPLTGLPVGAEEDLELLRNAGGVFYVGANPRVPGTGVPHPFYMRDIFKLSSLPNGSWTISEVGDTWEHFDRAATIAQ